MISGHRRLRAIKQLEWKSVEVIVRKDIPQDNEAFYLVQYNQQRIKLASELSKRATGKTLYILDEPTTGLHFADIENLLKALFQLRDQGNTILIVEHHLDIIKMADYVIDLGPEGGPEGGALVASGSPEEIVRVKGSYTGHFLKRVLEPTQPPASTRGAE